MWKSSVVVRAKKGTDGNNRKASCERRNKYSHTRIMTQYFWYECKMESNTSELKARGCICQCFRGKRRRESVISAIIGTNKQTNIV